MNFDERADAVAERMATQLRVRGDGLREVTQKAGRKLPRRLRQDAETLALAGSVSGHPKLARRIDDTAVLKAEKRLNAFLAAKDPRAERIAEFLDTLAKIAFVFVVIVLGAFFYLLNTGYFD